MAIVGCGGKTSPNSQTAARVKMASFTHGALSFWYPAAWPARQRLLMTTSDSAGIVYLTQARLHNPCKHSTNAYGGVGISCRGGVLDALPPGDLFVSWSVVGDGPEPANGDHLVIDGHRAVVSYRDIRACDGIRGGEAGIAAAIAEGAEDNWYEMTACMRGPRLRLVEAQVRAMLGSVKLHASG